VSGIAPTKPGKGNQLDASSSNSQKYVAHLKKEQADFAAENGVTPATTYQVVLNGFSADLTADQVGKLQTDKDVLGVFPDEIYHPTAAVPSTEFLGLGSVADGTGGVWDSLGGTAGAGKGIVVGIVDTGISPENPAFAGSKLSTKAGSEPYLVGENVVYKKSDGGTFVSQRVSGEQWGKQDYSTKLIGARYFNTGAAAAGFSFKTDYASPRDLEGHGSHTASTAAGNFGVSASVEGIDFGKISGVAPAAKVAAYKACYGRRHLRRQRPDRRHQRRRRRRRRRHQLLDRRRLRHERAAGRRHRVPQRRRGRRVRLGERRQRRPRRRHGRPRIAVVHDGRSIHHPHLRGNGAVERPAGRRRLGHGVLAARGQALGQRRLRR
jgi:hypothetical protein